MDERHGRGPNDSPAASALRTACCVLTLVASGACAPSFSSGLSGSNELVRASDDREQARNREALRTLAEGGGDEAPADGRPHMVTVAEVPGASDGAIVVPASVASAQTGETGTNPVRARLHSILRDGPHRVLGAAITEPARDESGRLLGFRIVGFPEHIQLLRRAGFQVGDVVQRVNGAAIVEADAFHQVWGALETTDEVRVELLRDGEPVVMRWNVSRASGERYAAP